MKNISGIEIKMFPEQQEELLSKLKTRFVKNLSRHPDIACENVFSRLKASE